MRKSFIVLHLHTTREVSFFHWTRCLVGWSLKILFFYLLHLTPYATLRTTHLDTVRVNHEILWNILKQHHASQTSWLKKRSFWDRSWSWKEKFGLGHSVLKYQATMAQPDLRNYSRNPQKVDVFVLKTSIVTKILFHTPVKVK